MATATKRKFISGVSVICAVMLIVGIFPIVTNDSKVEATDTGEYFYTPAKLYDYYYDTDNGKSFDYTKDHEIYDSEQMINGQKNGNVYKGGNRWRTQLQVPYEKWNREISAYYNNSALNGYHALYFGNFYGTNDTNPDNERHRTYKEGQDGYYWYSDVYNNFYLNSNNAPSENYGRVSVQGLVDNTLSEGTSDGTVTQNGVPLPQFNDSFVSGAKNADVFAIENGFPFNVNRHERTGLVDYSYDSLTDGNRYYKASSSNPYSGTIEVQKAENGHDRSSKNFVTVGIEEANNETGFYPFNGNQSIDSTYNGRENVNYGFGMRLDIPFNLTEDGKLRGKDGSVQDIIFNFSGDDDIWVFLDGKLVLDMGGDHGRVTGSVNFNIEKNSTAINIDHVTAAFTDKKRTRAGTDSSYTADLSSRFGDAYKADGKYDTDMIHTMTVFYMERGMFESNLKINFNFQPVKNNLTIVEHTYFDNVNQGLLADTVKVSEEDVFRYHVQNQGTSKGGVTGSSFLYPSTNTKIIRNNTQSIGNENRLKIENKAVLNKGGDTPVAENKFYLDASQPLSNGGANNYWDDSAKLIAYVYKDGESGTHEFINMNRDSGQDHLYSVDLTGKTQYDRIIFLRCDTNADASMGSNLWNRIQDNGNNRTPKSGGWNLKGESNTVRITGWSNSAVYGENHSSAGSGTNSNFEPENPDNFNNVANVTYELTDPYATKENGDALKEEEETPFTKNTDSSGNVDLMYGQSAYFDGQFRENTKMRVTQSDKLYQPNYTGEEVTFSESDRVTGEYYYTTVEAVNKKEETLVSVNDENFATFNKVGDGERNGEYDFKNNDGSAPVSVTETYVNRIKVGSLELEKVLDPDESGTHTFVFQLELTKIFGKDGVNASDYAGITVEGTTLNADGTFTLNAGESMKITGIPVKTEYTITELYDEVYIAKGSSVIKGTIEENKDDKNVLPVNKGTITNTRRLGTLTLAKEVVPEDPSDISSEEINRTYDFEVTLKMPAGVNFDNYKTDVGGTWKSSDGGITWTATFPVAMDSNVRLTHIPYGTQYTVAEHFSEHGWTKTGEVSDKTLNIGNSDPTVTVTNTKQKKDRKAYQVTKAWVDYTPKDNDNITLSLTGSDGTTVGQYTVTINGGMLNVAPFDDTEPQTVCYGDDSWEITFQNLLKYDETGEEITYHVQEVAVNGVDDDDLLDDKIGRFTVAYSTSATGEDIITNTYKYVPLEMPDSGGTGREDNSFNYVLLGTGAVMLSAWAFFLIIKRRRINH